MTGIVQVRDLLLEHPPGALHDSLTSSPSLSKKVWTDGYHPILNPNIHMLTLDGINQSLAADYYSPNSNSAYTADPTDQDRLDRSAFRLNYPDYVHIQKEGDVDRDFYQNIAIPVSLAWQKNGNFLERSISGPPGPSSVDKTVDHLYSWKVGAVAGNERCQVIGGLKQDGVINIDEWEGRKEKRDITKRLGRELRGYAHLYKCPQVFVYDGMHLLVIQFRAKDVNDIKSANCPTDCCVLARTPENAQCAARYALYKLVWRGWMRLTGEWSQHLRVSLGGWVREFRFWSGRPYWVNLNTGQKEMNHPAGYMRRFDRGSWFWVDEFGNVIVDMNGNVVWDSWL